MSEIPDIEMNEKQTPITDELLSSYTEETRCKLLEDNNSVRFI